MMMKSETKIKRRTMRQHTCAIQAVEDADQGRAKATSLYVTIVLPEAG